MKRKLFKDSLLYLILDRDRAGDRILDIAKTASETGVDLVQFRDKHSSDKDFLDLAVKLKKIFRDKQIFIINDRVDIARFLDADGLHLGQDDSEIRRARKILGRRKIIGLSCHNLIQTKQAEALSVDYISIGPIFATPLKPDYKIVGLELLKKIREDINLPFFAIGGINLKNLKKITALGVRRVAVCRFICGADNIKNRVTTIKRMLSFN